MATSHAQTHLPPLGDHYRDETGHLLQLTLVELVALSLIGKQLHWNIAGHGFRELHLHLDEVVDEVREASDVVAERAAAIGVAPDGRAPTVAAQAQLEAVEAGFLSPQDALRELTSRIAVVDERIRERAQRLGEIDLASQDVLVEVTRMLEKQLWMLRSGL